MGWLSDNNVPGGKLMETFGKKVGETAKDGLDDFTTSSLIKKCESELETTKADDIPVGADVSTETGKLIQLALKIDNVNGKVGEDTIEVLNKRIEEEFASKPEKTGLAKYTGAISDAFGDKFEDLKGRKYNDASDIDGRTLEFLSQSLRKDDAFGDTKTLQIYAKAMSEIADKADNSELQMAAHKLAPEVIAAPQQGSPVAPAEPELNVPSVM